MEPVKSWRCASSAGILGELPLQIAEDGAQGVVWSVKEGDQEEEDREAEIVPRHSDRDLYRDGF